MAKKEAVTQKKEKTSVSSGESFRIEKVLVENFVSLQQVMTNLALKFDNLSGQISKLLELFEISAKSLAEKGGFGEDRADKRAAEKLDSLLEQSKVIAKGVALLHEKSSSEQRDFQEPRYPVQSQVMRPMQQMSQQQQRPPYDFSKNPRIGK